jgi:predicted NAD/FAD-binding protein
VIGGGIAGVAAAWSLDRSGFPVELFERGPSIGGNAKTFRWSVDSGEVESPLLVIAWPEIYYHSYRRLLDALGVESTSMPIAYFVQHPHGTFCQDGRLDLYPGLERDFRRWKRLVRVAGRINDFFLGGDRRDSLYHLSYWNPLNLIPLYALARAFGISNRFWDEIFVPIHCASFITTKMKHVPAVIGPLVESVVPLERPGRMGTWVGAPRRVFDRMTEPFRDRVHTSCEISAVRRRGTGYRIESADGREFDADEVVFACQAPSILRTLEQPGWLERGLLGRVRYVDDADPTFSRCIVHSDPSIFPDDQRERILREFNTYTEVDSDGDLECTFVVSARNPALEGLSRPMLVTFGSKKPIGKVEAEFALPNPTHELSLPNLVRMLGVRFIQGRRGLYYCGSFTTPEGAHDISFLSGLVAARAVGADYPFTLDDGPAVADYHQMQRIMLGRVLPDVPPGD